MPLFPLLEELYENTMATVIYAKSAATPAFLVAAERSHYSENEYSITSDPDSESVEEAPRTKRVKNGDRQTKLDFTSRDTSVNPIANPKN